MYDHVATFNRDKVLTYASASASPYCALAYLEKTEEIYLDSSAECEEW